jgi:hypothetical protein
MYAIFAPSGDHRAHLSCAFDEFVKFRVAPFSIGAVNTSPRATNNARSPFGLNSNLSIALAAETCEGRIATASVGTVIEMCVVRFVAVSNKFNSPFSS